MLRCASMDFRTGTLIFFCAALLCQACASAPHSSAPHAGPPPLQRKTARSIIDADYDKAGARLWFLWREGSTCGLSVLNVADRKETRVRGLESCPTQLDVLDDSALLLTENDTGRLIDQEGKDVRNDVIAAADRSHLVVKTSDGFRWIHGQEEKLFTSNPGKRIRILPASSALMSVAWSGESETLRRLDFASGKSVTLAGPFRKVDSYDVSPDEKEFVIAADAGKGFDVAVGSTSSSALRPVGSEVLPETMVSWAPRGNKITYLLETGDGTIVRTVHVPTAFQVAAAFDGARVEGLAWEPRAERFAVVLSSPSASGHIRTVAYGGEAPTELLAPELSQTAPVERLQESSRDDLVTAPRAIRYGQRYPVVIWTAVQEPYAWNDARAAVIRNSDVGVIVTPRAVGELDQPFWASVLSYPWVDSRRLFVVAGSVSDQFIAPDDLSAPVTVIVPGSESEGTITAKGAITVRAPSHDGGVEWAAADYIAARLAGDSAEDDHR